MPMPSAVMSLPQQFFGICPSPWSLPANRIQLSTPQMCSTISYEREIVVRIRGGTAKDQDLIKSSLMTIQKKNPFVARYIDFVFAYLENFSIQIVSDKTSDAYNSLTHTLYILEETARSIALVGRLNHEFRHAYWHALQTYSFGSNAQTVHCFFPITSEERSKVASYIQKGDERVTQLAKDLFNEKQLSLSKKAELEKLREQCKITRGAYSNKIKFPCSKQQVVAHKIGEIYFLNDISTEQFFGFFKVVAMQLQPEPELTVVLQDPLRHIVKMIQGSQVVVRAKYNISSYEYEREAYLYEHVPLVLLQELFPELLEYTTRLENQPMVQPNPVALGRLLVKSDDDIYENTLGYLNSRYMMSLGWEKNGLAFVTSLLANIEYYMSQNHDLDRFHFALTSLLQQGIAVEEANLLIARLASKESDGLNACRYYHRAFKQGADFTFEDYIDCLDNLINHDQWGNAKIISQKVRAGYRQQYGFIPVELEEKWKRIKQHRKGQ